MARAAHDNYVIYLLMTNAAHNKVVQLISYECKSTHVNNMVLVHLLT